MAKGARYTGEFRAKGVRLLAEGLVFVGDERDRGGGEGPGDST